MDNVRKNTLEQKVRLRKRRKDISKIVLRTILTAGMLSTALVAPNVLGALGKMGIRPNTRQKDIINRARDRLLKKGYLCHEGRGLAITPRGEARLRFLEPKVSLPSKPRRWDGKWRVLIFDIPERRNSLRKKIRITLIAIGFVRLQDSVWVYPYDCEEYVALLKADFHVGKDLLYMIVEEMEGALTLKRHFGLPVKDN